MRWVFLATVALALAFGSAAANEVEFISPRDGMLTNDDTLVVIGRAQRGQRLNWSVRREGATESDTVTADWGNLFEIFVLLDPGVNRIRVENASIEVFYDAGDGDPPPQFRPQFVHAADLALCEDCHEPRHLRLLDGGYPWVCFGCHLVVSNNPANPGEAISDSHFQTAVADCARCHEPHLSADPKLLRASLSNLCGECHPAQRDASSTHRALDQGECSACHDPHYSGYPAHLHQPLPGLRQQCHDQGLAAGAAHPALIDGDSCGACHDPHGNGEDLLVDQAEVLCSRCHAQITRRGHGEELANCEACHDSHGTREGGMLRTGAPAVCLSATQMWPKAPPATPPWRRAVRPATGPTTTTTGAAPESPAPAATIWWGTAKRPVCTAISTSLLQLAAVATLPTPQRCPRLVRGNLHQPLAQGNCSACHGGGEDRSTVVADPSQRCRMCHDFEKDLRAGGARLHQPLLDGECTTCHDPHMSTRPAFLRNRETVLCRECHNTPKLEAGQTRHSAAENCSGCHLPHGGSEAAFLRFSAEDLCAACHETVHKEASHPPAEMGCRTCHDPHGGYGGANLLTPRP